MEGKYHEITPYTPVKPLVDADEALRMWDSFEKLKRKLLVPVDRENSDYQRIHVYDKKKGKKVPRDFIKKSGFRKFAMFFGISDEIIDEVREPLPDGDGFLWRIKVKATYPNGRETIGVGVCASTEVHNKDRVEHDCYSTAHTRAKNRAISDMIAGGIVSAEEMSGEYNTFNQASQQTRAPKDVNADVRVIDDKAPASKPTKPKSTPAPAPESRNDQESTFKTTEFIDNYPPGVVKGVSWWEEYLSANGVKDVNDVVEIREANDRVVITRKGYLPENVWRHINDIVKSRQGKWMSQGENSRWEVLYESARQRGREL